MDHVRGRVLGNDRVWMVSEMHQLGTDPGAACEQHSSPRGCDAADQRSGIVATKTRSGWRPGALLEGTPWG